MTDMADWIAENADRHPATIEKLQWFEYEHLTVGLMRDTSQDCADLALAMVQHVDDGPQLTLGLQKLIEAKDCFVRAALQTKRNAEAKLITEGTQ